MTKTFHPEALFTKRRKTVSKFLGGHVMILPTNPEYVTNRDLKPYYAPDSDFFYLTGISEPNSTLVIQGQGSKPKTILYIVDRNPLHERWEGERLGIQRARKTLSIDEVRPAERLRADLPDLIRGAHELHFPIGINPELDSLLLTQLQSPAGPRLNIPHTIRDSRAILSELRIIKDSYELNLMRSAAEVTCAAFRELFPKLPHISTEYGVARELEALFAKHGGTGIAFPTIIAAGKHATTLHHSPGRARLAKKQLVLIDAGASFEGYASDVTRTVPLSGVFSAAQKLVYEIVLRAHDAVIKKASPRTTLDELHRLSVHEITKGLVEAKIIRGPASAAILAGKYRPFYMHRIGHWLGIDTHDTAPVIDSRTRNFLSSANRPLVAGNVFTVEPGVYIDSKEEGVPEEFRGIGVRIENNVVITTHGREVITGALPTSISEIEALMRG